MASSNLPVQLTSFIGRKQEMADVRRLLMEAHLVTLTGAGGSGKTRLALQVAAALSHTFADGVWLVDLAPLHEPSLVPQIVTLALGLRPAADQPALDTLLSFIQPKQLLLILDNCEHLSQACAQLAQRLLSQSPELRILATSRAALAVAGEAVYPLSGLDWPDMGGEAAQEVDLQKLMGYGAVRLFVERARAISPRFDLTPQAARSTVEVCRRLDGLPLALELASARVNVLTVQEISARLGDRFALLFSDHTGYEPRHHTLRAAIDWSFVLLTPEEKTLFSRLAVFSAGLTLDMAEAVCSGGGMDAGRIIELLSSLVNKSLVVAHTIGRSQARYRLLETIREYALEKLDEAGETARLRDRHLDLFLARVEDAAPKLGEAYQQLWLNWLEDEHDNLRAALAWSLESGRIAEGLRIASGLVRFWEIRGYVQEGMTWFERLLARTGESVPPVVRVNALVFASFMAMFLGNAAATLAYGREAVEIAEGIKDENNPALTFALAGLASGTRAAGDFQTAFTIGERVIQLLRGTGGSPFFLGMALLGQGDVAIQLGYYDTARERLIESLSLAQKDGDSFRIAHTLNTLGDLARLEQHYEEAKSAYEQCAALLRQLGAQRDLASILANLGFTWLHLESVEHAQPLFHESMAIHLSQNNQPGMVECLYGFAACAMMLGPPAAGVRLLAAASASRGQPTSSVWLATRMEFEHYLDLARARLSTSAFQAEQVIGRAMSLEQAVDYAQNLSPQPGIAAAAGELPGGLTRRERQVIALIGQGKSNGEIAAELVLSKRTVETHVSHILSRLGLSSRGQVMRWAIDHGLNQPPV